MTFAQAARGATPLTGAAGSREGPKASEDAASEAPTITRAERRNLRAAKHQSGGARAITTAPATTARAGGSTGHRHPSMTVYDPDTRIQQVLVELGPGDPGYDEGTTRYQVPSGPTPKGFVRKSGRVVRESVNGVVTAGGPIDWLEIITRPAMAAPKAEEKAALVLDQQGDMSGVVTSDVPSFTRGIATITRGTWEVLQATVDSSTKALGAMVDFVGVPPEILPQVKRCVTDVVHAGFVGTVGAAAIGMASALILPKTLSPKQPKPLLAMTAVITAAAAYTMRRGLLPEAPGSDRGDEGLIDAQAIRLTARDAVAAQAEIDEATRALGRTCGDKNNLPAKLMAAMIRHREARAKAIKGFDPHIRQEATRRRLKTLGGAALLIGVGYCLAMIPRDTRHKDWLEASGLSGVRLRVAGFFAEVWSQVLSLRWRFRSPEEALVDLARARSAAVAEATQELMGSAASSGAAALVDFTESYAASSQIAGELVDAGAEAFVDRITLLATTGGAAVCAAGLIEAGTSGLDSVAAWLDPPAGH